ncbi:sialate O-acetylesterase [uncultured Alistipes sp.]|uniref:sialate O-acetylesterase n=1 Tax=uncultured Alistipes sp. TaxID=538949 RepID=UPI00266F4DFC|nr:sialate O-acetylesterase [uncultured Alistipes sp.]
MKRIVLLWLAAAWIPAEAKVTLPALFGDNMVLQQQREVRIWGYSDRGEVALRTSWSDETHRAKVRDGRWQIAVQTPAGSYEPQTLTVSDTDSETTLHNVLVGEVWVCSGQSNMYMPLRGYTGQPVDEALPTVLEAGEYRDRIRMITLPKREAETPQRDFEGRWEIPSPETALRMSATAYYFARTLTQALGVPAGIVSTSWGGSKIEAWMDPATLAELGYDVEKINADPKVEPRAKCGLLYNGLIAPITGFAARGFVWYQGESNRREAPHYARLMERLAAYWRAQWGDTKNRMPFLYVQIAPHAYKQASGIDAALLVEAQSDALERIPNSAMVATTDLGDERCIHPSRKRPVGERLAAAALVKAYGRKMPDALAVRFAGAEFADGKAVVRFDNARLGLTPQNKEITGFELAGADGIFHPATGRIVTSKPMVEVTSPEVPEPTAVRYSFRNYAPGNLSNTLGIPVIPFRTDRGK